MRHTEWDRHTVLGLISNQSALSYIPPGTGHGIVKVELENSLSQCRASARDSESQSRSADKRQPVASEWRLSLIVVQRYGIRPAWMK